MRLSYEIQIPVDSALYSCLLLFSCIHANLIWRFHPLIKLSLPSQTLLMTIAESTKKQPEASSHILQSLGSFLRVFMGQPVIRRILRRHPSLYRRFTSLHQKLAQALYVTGRSPSSLDNRVKLIAMHLPQFHRIPENDLWWGEGFTEWTNVRRARPMYSGHYQPHVPHPDTGYYDLSIPAVLERQAAMARRHGIFGFCFYYYWFDGRKLLEKPLQQMLDYQSPDFPFCICWANENWTRTWDGLDRELLVAQRHDADSDIHFMIDILPILRDPRYIRVDNKPVLLVYRPGLMSDPLATSRRWREICHDQGIDDLFLVSVRSFDKSDPREVGFDAAMQFPPLQIPSHDLTDSPFIKTEPGFQGVIRAYQDAIEFSLSEDQPDAYPLYLGIMPSWDNTARRMERGTSWLGATPYRYGHWLRKAIERTINHHPPSQRLLFVNAWNEWAEGAHLEPDLQFGYRFLQETCEAILDSPTPNKQPLTDPWKRDLRILVISHDAALAGAQMVLLRTLRAWKRMGLENVRIVCVEDGILRANFVALYPTLVLSDEELVELKMESLARFAAFHGQGSSFVYSNTVVNGPILSWIRHLGIPIVTHAHELERSIQRWAPGHIFQGTVRNSDCFLAAAPSIKDNLVRRHRIPSKRISIVSAHIEIDNPCMDPVSTASLRQELSLDLYSFVVVGCGTTDWRKGPDLFCAVAESVVQQVPDALFLWIGGDSDYHQDWIQAKGLASSIRFLGTRLDVREILQLVDLFFLPSREDPMPLVALEAAAASLPIVCFEGAGDIPVIFSQEGCISLPMEDIHAASTNIVHLANNSNLRARLGAAALATVSANHDSHRAAALTLHLLAKSAGRVITTQQILSARPLVSVIVPNYNHATYLGERLRSITAQGIADIELILLDDCSTDESASILHEYCLLDPRARLYRNDENSGSTFRQWQKGLALARGHYVWIAESDDSAAPVFLQTLVGLLEANPDAVFAYSQSMMIDVNGQHLGIPLQWTNDLSTQRWRESYVVPGHEELRLALIHKNTIPNVSAVLFRNSADLIGMIDVHSRLCGDWLAYVRLCGMGSIAFTPEPLNYWRQNSSNVRTRPPGVLEWEEGQAVIRAASGILGFEARACKDALERFRHRCQDWELAWQAERMGQP